MKIKKLNIKSHRHLENVNFDFTYPEGHRKAGKPLDKICIIGQSATGKTNILELLKYNISALPDIEIVNDTYLFNYKNLNFDGSIEYLYKNESLVTQKGGVNKNGREFPIMESGGGSVANLIKDGLKLLYFSSDIISKKAISILNQNPLTILNILSEQKLPNYVEDKRNESYIYEFLQDIDEEIWFSLLSKILNYRKAFTQMASELINKGAIGDLTRLNKEYAKWSEANENPLVPFAEYFNPILGKLNLEIDLVNTEYSIPVKSKFNDEIIPISGLSTGTQGLLLSLFPLFQLDTTDSIILLDEPERSLFPDMQIDLISHYQRFAPSAQFLIATHSPFIAAAFEPEERFILYFDKVGKVAVRRGESPIGDDPNDILRNDFKVDYYNDFGKKAYGSYLDLKRRMTQETEPEKKKELLIELTQLGDKYNF